ncbi:Uma2 family endonuclease [Butyrivibrio sp. DSM 10294]|uniref:Uma2 family endonuclease n=1 Tax=Butyrivibrio sp. DSM 10294 TaxID=2972457 RepID=UPI00234E7E64|nr:Uma2 family endonuclease [Butyrivibrio sp. DSM 10294]MDC7292761.1 Uma2 family endonuclease [Butyrivibrio sp. DSM 10294]
MTIDEMKQRKKELGFSFKMLSELSGVPLGTVQKIFNGETKAPRYETIEKLSRILMPKPASYLKYIDAELLSPGGVMEEPAVYNGNGRTIDLEHFGGKVQGEYTIEDYYALPNDVRVELIDGYFYYMTASMTRHQLFVGELFRAISNYIRDNKGKCIPFMAPTDVQLDCDNKTIVQPDIFILCNPDKLTEKNLFGNPDFIIEVLSPSTSRKDRYIKTRKYKDAGVREYWLVDPWKKNVLVYIFDAKGNDDDIAIYGFDKQVPVGIYDGKLKIDFRDIDEYIEQVYGKS